MEPKRRALAIAEGDEQAASAKLAKAQKELKAVQDKLEKLEQEMAESVAKEKKLTYDMDMCVVKLDNAGKLINGLGGEKERWTDTVLPRWRQRLSSSSKMTNLRTSDEFFCCFEKVVPHHNANCTARNALQGCQRGFRNYINP